jgi:alpha-mannosidase
MKEKTVHMIGNAHIDPVWLWQWPEGFHEVKATFRSALDRMKEYEEFLFISSSAAFYQWVEESDPAMFAEIQQRVAEGRWGIVGGWWIQPDCNLPGGESFVRQALYGQRYFKEKFGLTATVGYNVDSFGHHGMLPQLLKKSGLDYYIFLRPSPHERGLPGRLFWWASDDGSQVLAFRIPYEYCTSGKDLEKHIRRCAGELKSPLDEMMCFYGVGNHGGGPTRENIESIQRLADAPDLPRLVFSRPECFFQSVLDQQLPIRVVHDELQHHASGCYAAHSGVKRWNRLAENRLIAAEKFAAIAYWLTGQPYPADFALAWKDVLFNQFHDILAGTSLEAAYDDAHHLYGEALSIADRGLNHAIQSLAWNIGIEAEAGVKPFVVFNPHAWPVKLAVEVELGSMPENAGLLDDAGRSLPFQMIKPSVAARGRNRFCFVAELPALGYRTYRLVPQAAGSQPEPLPATDTTLENDRFCLEFNPETGLISRLWDKQEAVEVFLSEAARPVVMADPSDTWGHNVYTFNQPVGTVLARRVRCVAAGPVKAAIRVESEYGRSKLIQEFTLYRELDQIEVQVTVDWHEPHTVLKLQFPVKLDFARQSYEIPYGHIERPANGEEEPGQSWLDISGVARDSGELYGLSLLNDGKYSFDVLNKVMSLTVLRNPIYAHHIPFAPDPDEAYTFTDHGRQRFNYTLLPHRGSWESAGTVRRAAELNQRPIVLLATYHPEGSLPQQASYLSVDQENIIVSAVKVAEEGDDLIVRAYETNRVATRATIRLPQWNRLIEAHFAPCEIKTFRVPRAAGQPIVETNLLEWVE